MAPQAGLEIRLVRPEEYERAGALTAQVYVEGGFIPRSDPYVHELADLHSRATAAETWVAIEAQDVLGVVTYCPVGSPYREVATTPEEAEFRMLAVSGAARGKGVGTALVEAMLTRAREDGHQRMVMCTMSAMTDAARLYARLGFTRLPALDWSPENTKMAVCLLGYGRAL